MIYVFNRQGAGGFRTTPRVLHLLALVICVVCLPTQMRDPGVHTGLSSGSVSGLYHINSSPVVAVNLTQ